MLGLAARVPGAARPIQGPAWGAKGHGPTRPARRGAPGRAQALVCKGRRAGAAGGAPLGWGRLRAVPAAAAARRLAGQVQGCLYAGTPSKLEALPPGGDSAADKLC